MFWVRFRSSVILMVITIASLLIGRELLFGVLVVISMIGLRELFKVVKMENSLPALIGYLAGIVYAAFVYFNQLEYMFTLCVCYLLLLLFAYVFCFPKYKTEQITVVFFGLFYTVIMLLFIYQVRSAEGGKFLVWLIFIGAWGSDTFAYLIGRSFGKHKIFPVLSPKKSAEGCIAGILGAAFLGFLFAAVFYKQIDGVINPMISFAIIGGCASTISQIGDLAASAIKRQHEIKDYGTLIPGHGGVLDRFDSIIVTAPLVYFLAQLL